jgi:hypothetical protein
MPEFRLNMFLLGCIGGLLPDILRIIKHRHDPGSLAYLKSGMFWVGLILLVLVGGLSAWVLQATDIKQALAYGFGAPELLSRFLGREPDVDRGEPQKPPLTLTAWWGR